jgi:hypothetical protein
MADKNFEQQVQEQMEQFKLSPSNNVWQNVDAQLRKDKRRKRFFFLLSFAALLGIGTIILYKPSKNSLVSAELQQTGHTSASAVPVTATENQNRQQQTPVVSKKVIESHEETDAASATAVEKTFTHPVVQNRNSAKSKYNPLTNSMQVKTKGEKRKPAFSKNVTGLNQTDNKICLSNQKNNQQVQTVNPHAITSGKTPNNYSNGNTTFIQQQTTGSFKPSSSETKIDTAINRVSIDPPPVGKEEISNKKATFDSAAAKPSSLKRKWQKGWSLNAGIADVRSSPIPAAGFYTRDSYAIPYNGTSSLPGGLSGFVLNEYSVRNNLQAGIGYGMRFPVWKQSWFAAGVQYQYSSFKVIDRARRDTFSVAQNRLVNDFSNETKSSYSVHYLSIPTELQLHIAGTENSSVKLNAGMQHQFRIALGRSLPSFARDSSVNRSGAAFYQPLLYIAPAYEWKTNKGIMQLGWYVNYALAPVYRNTPGNNWWQTGLRLQYWFKKK